MAIEVKRRRKTLWLALHCIPGLAAHLLGTPDILSEVGLKAELFEAEIG
jgi:hypothetical protein